MSTSARRSLYTNPSARDWVFAGLGVSDAPTRFHRSLPGFAPSPLIPLDDLAKELRVKKVFVKDESSRLGLPSFKILGASWATVRAVAEKAGLPVDAELETVTDAAKRRDVTLFAATDGNHGRAVARMASILGVKAEVYVPKDLDLSTRQFIIDEGANVTVTSGDYDFAVHNAAQEAENQGGVLIQDTSFEGYEGIPKWVVEGYSTMLREIDDQLEDSHLDVIVTPVGVGSLAQAVVSHSKAAGRSTSVLTVEPDTAACLWKSLTAGESTTISTINTIMSGINCGTASPVAWPILRAGVDASTTISDFEAHEAVQYLSKHGISAGPCGAAPVAALRHVARSNPRAINLSANSVVVLLCTEASREYVTPIPVSISDPVLLTQQLVRIDSSNPGLSVAPGAGETAIATYIASWLQHRDFETHWLEKVPGRPSVVGVARGSGGGKSLMYNGHIDTVTLVGYEGDPLSGDIHDGKIHGRGAVDMKPGVAASMVALVRAKEANLRGDVVLAAVADEKNLSIGTEEVREAGWHADGAIISEPTNLDVVLSHKGFVWLEIDILGVASHGSRPDLGVDAITKAGYFLVELDKYSQKLMSGPKHGSLGTGTVHAGLIKGGEEQSSYPAKCTISVERRTVPGETDEVITSDMQKILSAIARTIPDFKSDVRVTFSRPPFQVSESDPFIATVLRTVEKTHGRKPVIRPEGAWTDCALLSEKGIPVLLYGVAGEGLHAKKEFATVESLEMVVQTLTGVAVEFCR